MRMEMVAGNWKMNKTLQDGVALVGLLKGQLNAAKRDVIVCPPIPLVQHIGKLLQGSNIKLGAQNCHQNSHGAHTGEYSAEMLKSIGVDYVILGHSERRAYFNEDDKMILAKIQQCLQVGLKIIYCCGELKEDRTSGRQNKIVLSQLQNSVLQLSKEEMKSITIAYEPVWAIGTGLTASPEQAQDMHSYIRKCISQHFDESTAENLVILYGGSCKPNNAEELFNNKDVDGGLIGGASLVAEDFIAIINA